ncbi:nucleotidyl transferase [Trema orientale]|uniref:Nucleotidyl transferase n=1 Tax=Trema orientale TaxID=63057 RepID=A0A2P5EBM6_TREOI|nr:nucleotidyl transferase [Trema orientale]
MDGVSNGAFLRGEESELGSDWVELEWLKDKGYYSIESFVANRLEVALRLAWLNCNSGKKRGVKLKEKVSAAGMAVNVFWRKKGCVDWWENLDASTRRKVFTAILGKAAKSLCSEIMKATSNASEDELWLFNIGVERPLRCNYTVNKRETKPTLAADAEFGSNIVPASLSGKPASLSNFSNSLFVLQDIVTMTLCQDSEYDKGKIFFSSLSSICTVSDFILRKVRGFLMVISLDCTKLELIAEDNVKSSPVKSKGKVGACNHKKKGRTRNTKKLNPVSGECVTVDSRDKSPKDLDCALSHKEKSELVESKKSPDVPQRKVIDSEASLLKEPAKAVGVGKAATTKTRREKGKNRMNGFKNPVEMTNCKRPVVEASSSSIVSQDDATNSCPVSAHLTFQNISGENSAENNILASNSVPSASFNGPIEEDQTPQSIQENRGPECCHFNESVRDNNTMEAINCKADVNVIPSSVHALDTNVSGNENSSFDESVHISEIDVKLASPKKGVRVFDIKEKHVLLQKQESRHVSDTATLRSLDGLPYEWPFVASTYFPPVNPHLLPATDRLHLDAGRNWHHHFRQSFVPAIHQRNIEGGCNPVLSRRVPMSLDWPPMVRGTCGLAPSLTCSNYDSGFISRWHCTFPQGFSINGTTTDDERKHSGDYNDPPDLISKHELSDDWDSHWISEDEVDVHAVSGIDYNEYFGGGVMYWNPSDHPAGGFSRPPSLSSDDSSWAWREADMNRAVDDMVAFSSPYSTNGLTSPTASFCSPFDKLGPAHQALGFVLTGNDVPGKVLHSPSAVTDSSVEEDASRSLTELTGDVEGNTGDSLPYHILPPIVIPNMTRDRSRSEFKSSHDVKSPCVPLKRREQSRMKRPPSPVVRCVTRAPRPPPPPPSPVSESRKHRGFPTVRSGSSSPRHWGVRGLFHDGASLEEACLYRDGAEVVWPSWRNTSFSGHSMIQPLPAALLQDRLLAMSHLARDQEHPDVALPMQPTELQSCPTRKASLSLMHTLLHDEIDSFCKQVASQNLSRKPYITWAVKRVTRSLQVLWPRSRTNIFGSNATGLALPTSDVDLVVCLPPVRNLEPIKEAGILEGRNGIKETCLQHAARYLANQDWVKNDSLKTVENTAIPIIMLVVEVPCDLIASSTSNVQSPKEEPSLMSAEQVSKVHLDGVVIEEPVLPKCSQMNYDTSKDSISVRIDISFKSPSHTGLQTTELVKELTEQFTAAMPLALVLKQFLADRSLDQSYSGGLSSYCLSLLITRFLQHEHHLGRPINQNFGSLLMDFLYFFGYVFDPRQMRISVRGSGIYIKRERGCSIDPIHIDDPLFPTNNVGRNCFRIHQCIKAFSEAYTILESELTSLSDDGDTCTKPSCRLLPKIIPSIDLS